MSDVFPGGTAQISSLTCWSGHPPIVLWQRTVLAVPWPSCKIALGMSQRYSEQKSEGILRHVVVAFLIALVIYLGGYSCDHYMRLRKGPWELTFASEPDGTPTLIINQPQVGVTNVTLRLTQEVSVQEPKSMLFTGPDHEPIPFGKVVFFDTTYLPGTVTFDFFGHEVELMPRTLVLNFEERAWQSGEVVSLTPEQKWEAVAKTNQVNQVNQAP